MRTSCVDRETGTRAAPHAAECQLKPCRWPEAGDCQPPAGIPCVCTARTCMIMGLHGANSQHNEASVMVRGKAASNQ